MLPNLSVVTQKCVGESITGVPWKNQISICFTLIYQLSFTLIYQLSFIFLLLSNQIIQISIIKGYLKMQKLFAFELRFLLVKKISLFFYHFCLWELGWIIWKKKKKNEKLISVVLEFKTLFSLSHVWRNCVNRKRYKLYSGIIIFSGIVFKLINITKIYCLSKKIEKTQLWNLNENSKKILHVGMKMILWMYQK